MRFDLTEEQITKYRHSAASHYGEGVVDDIKLGEEVSTYVGGFAYGDLILAAFEIDESLIIIRDDDTTFTVEVRGL